MAVMVLADVAGAGRIPSDDGERTSPHGIGIAPVHETVDGLANESRDRDAALGGKALECPSLRLGQLDLRPDHVIMITYLLL